MVVLVFELIICIIFIDGIWLMMSFVNLFFILVGVLKFVLYLVIFLRFFMMWLFVCFKIKGFYDKM